MTTAKAAAATILLTCLLTITACSRPGGVVAADHPLASQAGAEILANGGNAVDAAVATSLALSVVRPDACGIGGGGFMLIRLESHPNHEPRNIAINYRETCPAAIGPDTYEQWDDPLASRRGARAVAVPGTIAGLTHALDTYGTMSLSEVAAPAIRLAELGFPADDHHVRTAHSLIDDFEANPDWKQRFEFVWRNHMHEGAIEIGDLITQPEHAKALRIIAEQGADAFYTGPIADAIVSSIKNDNGVITHDDLANYRISETEPITFDLNNHTLLVMPPPSSGGVAIAQFLAILEHHAPTITADAWYEPETAHLIAEACKHAFADRARYMADPAFTDVPIDQMLDRSNIKRMAQAIDPSSTKPVEFYGSAPTPPIDGGTSHFSVVDDQGNAVSCTETINLAFGSLLAVDGYGFCLNDQMDDFTTIRGAANAFGLIQADDNLPQPGKRPLSSMSPTIVLDENDEVVALAGASGGPRIITSTAQVLLRMLEADATPEQAVNAPRIHHQWRPDQIDSEEFSGATIPVSLREALQGRNHTLTTRDTIGAVQAIKRDKQTNQWQAASDPRKGGKPARP